MARRPGSKFRFRNLVAFVLVLAALAATGYVMHLDLRVRSEFEGRRFALPARIYARPLELHAGLRVPQAAVEQELRDLGYRATGEMRPSQGEPGWFARRGDSLEISLRRFVFWDGPQEARRIRVAFDGPRLAGLRDAAGAELSLVRLEPLIDRGIYPGNTMTGAGALEEVPSTRRCADRNEDTVHSQRFDWAPDRR